MAGLNSIFSARPLHFIVITRKWTRRPKWMNRTEASWWKHLLVGFCSGVIAVSQSLIQCVWCNPLVKSSPAWMFYVPKPPCTSKILLLLLMWSWCLRGEKRNPLLTSHLPLFLPSRHFSFIFPQPTTKQKRKSPIGRGSKISRPSSTPTMKWRLKYHLSCYWLLCVS